MALTKNFVVRNGLEVANNLLFADSALNTVGVGTTVPLYNLDVLGDVALENRLLVGVSSSLIKVTTGIASAASPGVISGVNTSLIRINDVLTETNNAYFRTDTRVASIGSSIINLNTSHKNSIGSTTLTISFNRRVTSGNQDNVLVSNGEYGGSEWKEIQSIIAINVEQNDDDANYNVIFAAAEPGVDVENTIKVDANGLVYNPFSNRLGIGCTPTVELDVVGDITATGTTDTDELNVSTQSSLASAEATSLTVTPGDSNLENVFASAIEATSFRIGGPPSVTNFQIENYNFFKQQSTFSATVGIGATIDSYNLLTSNFKVAEYTFYIQNGANIQSQKLLLMQNGTTAFSEEYAIMYNPNIIVSIGATISGTTCRVLATPVTGTVGIVTYMFTRSTLI